jgi:hypothetical protein
MVEIMHVQSSLPTSSRTNMGCCSLRSSGEGQRLIGTSLRSVISPAPRAVWQSLLNADARARVDQTPAWLDCICAAGGYEDASRLYEFRDGRRLVLPLARRVHMPAVLTTQASMPFDWGTGGMVTADALSAEDVAAVWSDLAGLPILRTTIHPNPLMAEAWRAGQPRRVLSIPRLAHILDLDGGFDQIWSERFSAARRNNVRRAERSGLQVECDTSGRLVPVFYDLLRQSVNRWAFQQHEPRFLAHWRFQRRDPLAKFQAIAKGLGDACRIWVAWKDGRPVATLLVLLGANANAAKSAMDKEVAGPCQANALLHKLAIEDACRAGCHFYYLGESGASTALARFKSGFGARAQPYAEYRLERFPLTPIDDRLRGLVKRAIRFRDA